MSSTKPDSDRVEQPQDNCAPVKQRSNTDPKVIPKSRTGKIDFLPGGNAASYISQRSSSVETLETPNEGEHNNGVGFLPSRWSEGLSGECDDGGGMVHTCEAMPPTMFHPEHQSTPNQFRYRDFSETSPSEVSNVNTPSDISEEQAADDEVRNLSENQILMPGELSVPIMGFETMEARSKFTVYKIQVQIRSDTCGWFVFRRYSDFVHLNERLKRLFPGFRLALPPKRWFRDNFDKEFLEERLLGLQAFLNNITGHKDICNSMPVRNFFCLDEPPGPHDSLEESRALCDTLEETLYALQQELREKETQINLLKEEVELYRAQVEMLTSRLRERNTNLNKGESLVSPTSTGCSLAECDRNMDASPDTQMEEGQQKKVDQQLKTLTVLE